MNRLSLGFSKHRHLLAALSLLASAASAEAQLGLTLEEINQIPAFARNECWTNVRQESPSLPGSIELAHDDNHHALRFLFLEHGGRAVRVEFRKRVAAAAQIRVDEVAQNILEYNGGVNGWTRVLHRRHRKMWRRSDGAVAYYRNPGVFVLESPVVPSSDR